MMEGNQQTYHVMETKNPPVNVYSRTVDGHTYWYANGKDWLARDWVFELADDQKYRVCVVLEYWGYRLYGSFIDSESFFDHEDIVLTDRKGSFHWINRSLNVEIDIFGCCSADPSWGPEGPDPNSCDLPVRKFSEPKGMNEKHQKNGTVKQITEPTKKKRKVESNLQRCMNYAKWKSFGKCLPESKWLQATGLPKVLCEKIAVEYLGPSSHLLDLHWYFHTQLVSSRMLIMDTCMGDQLEDRVVVPRQLAFYLPLLEIKHKH
jgi:hypothetical protein